MRFTKIQSAITTCALGTLIALPASARAQAAKSVPGDVTFEMPVNLTKLWGEITKVAVFCRINSAVLVGTRNKSVSAQVEVPVSSGQVVTTVRVVVPVPPTSFLDPAMTITPEPNGQPATYSCQLSGFSLAPTTRGGGWNSFTADNTNQAFRVAPTPPGLSGTFTW